MKDWKVIISTKSGGGKAKVMWPRIAQALRDKGISFKEAFTEHQFHASELAIEAISEGYRKILAVGGDGAIHEILNGVMSQSLVPTEDITLGIIPVGSGNDWSRLYDIPKDYEEAVTVIANNHVVKQDVVCVDSINDDQPYRRYMMNIGGLGFDAQVCYLFELEKLKGKSGDAQYLKCLFKGFMGYRCPHFKIYVDGEFFFEGPALSVAIGNGKYCGGGLRQTPDAVPDDGLIDLTVIRRVPKARIILSVRRLLDGSIKKLKPASYARGEKIQIYSSPATFMEVDGEAVGCTPVTITIQPSAINVITNLKDRHELHKN